MATGSEPGIASKNGRVIELDGLRALAIIPVVFSHCCPLSGWGRFGEAGWMGVDLFFVLSGYLISGILLNTVGTRYYYRNFIVRRTLRIFPLYYLCLVLFTVATRLTPSQWDALREWGGVGWFFAYLGNVRLAWTGMMPPVFSFDPLWSLQVEEQFYLLYPIVVLLLSGLHLRRFLVGCVVAAPVLRLFLLLFVPGSGMARYVMMPCRMDSLALGGLVAILMRSPRTNTLTITRVRTGLLLAVAAVLLCAVISLGSLTPVMSTVGYTAVDITSALLLIMVVRWPNDRAVKWLRLWPLVYTGQIAYGLYLLHGPASWVARTIIGRLTGLTIEGHSLLSIPITFISAFTAAGLSWKFFESRILRMKDKLTRVDQAPSQFAAGKLNAVVQ